MNSVPTEKQHPEPDAELLDSVDTARVALLGAESEGAVGSFLGHRVDGPLELSLQFECLLEGYPGWLWTVSLARTEDGEPTVLETELLAGETSLLAPPWVPWSERLAEYRAQQKDAVLREQRAEEEHAAVDPPDDPHGAEPERRQASAQRGSAGAVSEERSAHDTSEHGDTSDYGSTSVRGSGNVSPSSSENEVEEAEAETDENSDNEDSGRDDSERGGDESGSRRSPRRRRRNSRRRRPRGRRRGE